MKNYKIAILIPHYNNPVGLYESLKSIKSKQSTLIVIIDDGSDHAKIPQKKVLDEALKFSKAEIFYHQFKKNKGIEAALNYGLKIISEHYTVDYIGRLDCGDLCISDRFDKQVQYLEDNKSIDLVGSWAEVIDENGKLLYTLKVPTDQKSIRKQMHISIAFVHPSIIFRSTLLAKFGNYPIGYTTAEDYAFLFNVVNHCNTANIPEPLLLKERSSHSISTRKRRKQLSTRLRVILDYGAFNFYYIYGVVRTLLLFLIPYTVMEKIKEKIL